MDAIMVSPVRETVTVSVNEAVSTSGSICVVCDTTFELPAISQGIV